MKRTTGCIMMLLLAAFSAGAQEVEVDPAQAALAALNVGELQVAQAHLERISDPAARLYLQARLEQASGDPKSAIQSVVQLIAQYNRDADWIAKGELLSAQLYLELGMVDEADVTARQVQALYEGTEEAETAATLRKRIEAIRDQSKGSTE